MPRGRQHPRAGARDVRAPSPGGGTKAASGPSRRTGAIGVTSSEHPGSDGQHYSFLSGPRLSGSAGMALMRSAFPGKFLRPEFTDFITSCRLVITSSRRDHEMSLFTPLIYKSVLPPDTFRIMPSAARGCI